MGLGISVLPKACIHPYQDALGQRAVTLDESWATREMKFCVRDLRSLPAAARLFIDGIAALP